MDRRHLLNAGLAAAGLAALKPSHIKAVNTTGKPRLGVVVAATDGGSPEQAIAKVHRFGLPTCQVAVGMSPPSIAEPLKNALAKYQVEATALMTLGEGRMVWDFYQGPETIGIVPRKTRQARMDALKRASDLAKVVGVSAVHTHCGFIPENPNDPLYTETVTAIHDVASHCKANGQMFLMETGQETPITLLRAIQDTRMDNIGVNLDVANLVLYGKADAVDALDVIGPYVHGMHAKDGLLPTNPQKLGEEVPIGKGRVRFPEVIRSLHKLSYTGPITIEREISGSAQEADIRASKLYLQKLIDDVYKT